jgi:hypothetical protein
MLCRFMAESGGGTVACLSHPWQIDAETGQVHWITMEAVLGTRYYSSLHSS